MAILALALDPARLGSPDLFAAPEAFAIDPVHSEIAFKVRHFVTKVPGRFNRFEGEITYDADKPAVSSGRVTIEAASIDTNNERRDGHLKSADFFDVEKFPTLTFVSKSVAIKENALTITGDLTIHGVTKPVTLTGEMGGVIPVSPTDKKLGFSASTKVNRKDFGILWNRTLDQGGTMLGDEVEISLDVEATHPGPKPEVAGEKAGD